jgi:hypothetical protein
VQERVLVAAVRHVLHDQLAGIELFGGSGSVFGVFLNHS